MEIRRYGARALLVASAGQVAHIDHPDVVEVVPGAETVLVVVRDATRLQSVHDWLAGRQGKLVAAGDSAGSGYQVVLDVVYDGDDLSEVAAATGLTIDALIERHSDAQYRCDFCGFSPGFAYLSGLDQRLRLPRRSTPRTSVPAGSVAIAGPYTAVYPSASPGGWHVLGHTDAALWDLGADPPALITPGTTVRFRRTEGRSGRRPVRNSQRRPPRPGSGPEAAQIGGRPTLRVVTAGVATSLQDRGRPGYARLAVPGSGAVDRRSADLVNRLVGNPRDAAVLETAGGLVLEVIAPGVVADSMSGAVQVVSPGGSLTVNPAADELWGYLAVRGGFAADTVLGSRSWDSLAKIGPRPPEPGDVLCAGRDPATPMATEQAPRPPSGQTTVIRVGPGPRADWFGASAIDMLIGTVWTVAATSRVGVRLTGGQPLTRTADAELPSEGLVIGAIQVPPDGQPVVMLADHPTTGGYPVIAVVEEADVARLAQRRPGTSVRFRPIDRMGG